MTRAPPPRWVVGGGPTLDFMDRAAASMLADALRAAIASRGRAALAVAGGRTPEAAFRFLSQADLDWSRVVITLVDERWVGPDSPRSNARLVAETLLRGPAAAARFVPMKSDSPDPEYRPFVAALPSEPFDAVLLGMGEDGHFASLFPGSPALAAGLDLNNAARAIAAPAGEGGAPDEPRLSLTLAEIVRAGLIVLLIKGRAKQRVIDDARAPSADPLKLPIAALLAARRDVRILQAE